MWGLLECVLDGLVFAEVLWRFAFRTGMLHLPLLAFDQPPELLVFSPGLLYRPLKVPAGFLVYSVSILNISKEGKSYPKLLQSQLQGLDRPGQLLVVVEE